MRHEMCLHMAFNSATPHYYAICPASIRDSSGTVNRSLPRDVTQRTVTRQNGAGADDNAVQLDEPLPATEESVFEAMQWSPIRIQCSARFSAETADERFILVDDTSVCRQCVNCCRAETEELSVRLRRCARPFVQRRLLNTAFNDPHGEYLLCRECFMYLKDDASERACKDFWVHDWPTVLSCVMCCDRRSDIRNGVWTLLPEKYCQLWRQLADRLSSTSMASEMNRFRFIGLFTRWRHPQQ
jgi:hypothetical protein